MKASLSYKYIGNKFPDLSESMVVVMDIAEIAGVDYSLLKNRMGMKRSRTISTQEVVITDKDLNPAKLRKSKSGHTNLLNENNANPLSTEWLKRPIV